MIKTAVMSYVNAPPSYKCTHVYHSLPMSRFNIDTRAIKREKVKLHKMKNEKKITLVF